ncbi:MAG: hypothetical protein IPP19_05725 [Verrucomicrobia bacterium]|nr:hypothetical protein [Verrucomicrobiota bacterium]
MLNGKLRLRLNANFARSTPPTKSDLGYLRTASTSTAPTNSPLYGATPNVRNADGTPLFSTNSGTVTSVAPGAAGSGGVAAFGGREGIRNTDLFRARRWTRCPARQPSSLRPPRTTRRRPDFRHLRRTAEPPTGPVRPFDFHSVISRGYDAFTADLKLSASAPSAPFRPRYVVVSLNEMAPALEKLQRGQHPRSTRLSCRTGSASC